MFQERFENIWDSEIDVVCVTTNGTVTRDGHNIMGGGIALEATQRIPYIDQVHGLAIELFGHNVQPIGKWRDKTILAFPTKDRISVNSSLSLITKSFQQLLYHSDIFDDVVIGLPRPGCNLGGLDWELQVKPLLTSLWNDKYKDRIIIFHYAQNGVTPNNAA